MENEKNQNNENQPEPPPEPPAVPPKGGGQGSSELVWTGLFVALLPSAIILCSVSSMNNSGNAIPVLGFFNVVLSFTGSYLMLKRTAGGEVMAIVGGICLGACFFFVNVIVGVLGGCACGGIKM